MFWTMMPTEADPRQSVTLCEHHALEETNAGMELADLGPAFGSMTEAYAILTGLGAMAGFDWGLISSEEGECHLCESETPCKAFGTGCGGVVTADGTCATCGAVEDAA